MLSANTHTVVDPCPIMMRRYQQKAVNTEIEVVCNSDGRFVRIQLLGEPRPLALREVEFYTGTFSPIAFSDTVGYEDIVAASCDDRFSPIDNDFQSQVVECTSQYVAWRHDCICNSATAGDGDGDGASIDALDFVCEQYFLAYR